MDEDKKIKIIAQALGMIFPNLSEEEITSLAERLFKLLDMLI